MKFSLVLASCIALATAAPTWTTDVADWYATVGRYVRDVKTKTLAKATTCDISAKKWNEVMFSEDTKLPKPNGTLAAVVLGRGVQNYTCNPSTPGAAPKAVGAIANLYDVSCYTNYPDLLHKWSRTALNFPTPDQDSPLRAVAELKKVGHHYFSAAGVPTFDLNDNGNSLGVAQVKPSDKIPAPEGSTAGQFNSGNGSVAWLLLRAVDGSNSKINTVYRVDTAGGNPPTTCEGSPAAFSVQYATLYYGWIEPKA